MKKISTLAVALITMGSLAMPAWADVVPTSTLPSGYYKIKSAAADRTRKNVFNDFSVSGNVNNVTLVGVAEGNTNNYIWHITNDGTSTTIGIVNGQGTPFTREDGNHGALGVVSYSTLTPKNVTSLESVLFGEYFHNPGNNDGNHTYGDYKGVAVYKNQDLDNTRWKLEQVDVTSKNIYTVSSITMNGAASTTAYISKGEEKARVNGFFISDATLTNADFTAPIGYDAEFTVNEANKTISVAYTLNKEGLQSVVDETKALLNKRGVGYPLEGSHAYNALKTVVESAEQAIANENTAEYVSASELLQSQMTTYRATTTDIQMPEDGKVYKMYGLNGANKYYAKNGENQNFVVQKIKDGTYRFVSTSGDQKGYTFESNIDLDLKVYRRINFGALNLASGTASIGINSNGSTGRFSNGNYVGILSGVGYSTDIYFEEVTDFAGQPVNFAASTDNKNYATLNLPYASKLPEGVTAYKAGNVVDNDLNIIAYKNAGEVLPANTPVLLTATSDGEKTFAPAPYAAAENTGFQGTLSAKAVTATNTYILSKNGGETVKFFALDENNNTINANKAYLVVSGGAAQALNFNFGITTGIQNAAVEGVNANAPLFDLSGRRVVKAVKGGIYIQNGKKFVK
uniref:hypothetical protein n=1 Tax=Alloprevotella sp. TaxID=1872471 RepID=UPI003FEEE5D6